MWPLDSRLRVDRDSREKYSTSARSRTLGLAAARRAIPTRPEGRAGAVGKVMWCIAGPRLGARIVSLFIRLLSRGDFDAASERRMARTCWTPTIQPWATRRGPSVSAVPTESEVVGGRLKLLKWPLPVCASRGFGESL